MDLWKLSAKFLSDIGILIKLIPIVHLNSSIELGRLQTTYLYAPIDHAYLLVLCPTLLQDT